MSFKGLQEFFGLTQSFDGPTHELGHTWDFTISYGLSITLRYQVIPLFNCAVPPPAIRLLSTTRRHWIFTPSAARRFAAAFKDSRLNADRRLVSLLWTDSLLLVFNSTCAVLDCVATLSPSSLIYWPHLQATTQAEWRSKVRLRVSFGLFRDSLSAY